MKSPSPMKIWSEMLILSPKTSPPSDCQSLTRNSHQVEHCIREGLHCQWCNVVGMMPKMVGYAQEPSLLISQWMEPLSTEKLALDGVWKPPQQHPATLHNICRRNRVDVDGWSYGLNAWIWGMEWNTSWSPQEGEEFLNRTPSCPKALQLWWTARDFSYV